MMQKRRVLNRLPDIDAALSIIETGSHALELVCCWGALFFEDEMLLYLSFSGLGYGIISVVILLSVAVVLGFYSSSLI